MKLPLWRVQELLSATGEFDPNAVACGYSIDSRTVQSGELFFAVKGERLDGHDFVNAALANGAVAAVVAREHLTRHPAVKNLMVVGDTLQSLQCLGMAVRKMWNKPLIAITGSAGKTTTKDATAHLLSKRMRVLKSHGNFNNHFGLPLQLLRLEPEHDAAVIELGMSHPGEIKALAKLAEPTTGVVTCVAPVHLESFSGVAEIARAKFELIESLHSGATAVLNADDPYVSQFGRDFHGKVMTFGMRHTADVCAEDVRSLGSAGSRFTLAIDGVREPVDLPLLGLHNVYNALAAACVAFSHGVAPSTVAASLAELHPSENRGEIMQLAGATIINDCYNSNPTALMMMIDTLATVPGERRIVVAGEMLELGSAGEGLHRQCGAHMTGKVDLLIGVRGLAQPMVETAKLTGVNAVFAATPEEAGELLAAELRPGDIVLMKASRGVKLERALEILATRFIR